MRSTQPTKTAFAVMLLAVSLAAAPLAAEGRAPVRQPADRGGASGEPVLTTSEILATALQNNRDLLNLRSERGLLDAERMKLGLLPNPTLDFEAATGALTGSPDESLLSVGLSQQFSIGGKRGKRLAVADAEVARFSARVKEQERLVRLEVKLAVHDLQLAQARADLAGKTAELNRQLLQVARERFAAGDVAELEVNLARVEVARSEGERAAADGELAAARLALAGIMGASSGTFRVAGPEESGDCAVRLEELKALAVKNRPELLSAKLEAAQGEAELQLARAERIPDLTAGIAVTRETSLTSVAGFEEKETDYLLGLTLSMPIPLFDRNQAGLRVAQSKISSATTKETLARQGVEVEVESARARLAASEKVLALYTHEIIPQLEENLKIVREAYQLGETGIAAVIEEQKKFHDVSEGRLRALQQRDAARARVEAAVGMDSTEICRGKE